MKYFILSILTCQMLSSRLDSLFLGTKIFCNYRGRYHRPCNINRELRRIC